MKSGDGGLGKERFSHTKDKRKEEVTNLQENKFVGSSY
jgi:hypothetical protein